MSPREILITIRLPPPRYDRRGFDHEGIHMSTGSRYNPNGFKRNGFDKNSVREGTCWCFNRKSYDRYGLDQDGFEQDDKKSP